MARHRQEGTSRDAMCEDLIPLPLSLPFPLPLPLPLPLPASLAALHCATEFHPGLPPGPPPPPPLIPPIPPIPPRPSSSPSSSSSLSRAEKLAAELPWTDRVSASASASHAGRFLRSLQEPFAPSSSPTPSPAAAPLAARGIAHEDMI
ncbi:uncharacterized protein K444DRAFT_213672 [Hyaloscypha bicolor E]|uniref:Uncharacterized protein n=1 Tax=Hyaloscypha bicolor E TaxID=1095630 RepID=A0A2J6TPY9_9HELO|nr:uncharacterized protein K444DRAFT_213672 [Hyaloscypha bicolor E]PMD65097.1 hypothetical protein K444DRAFT_213672 [Hyaloscypha bicolor E]